MSLGVFALTILLPNDVPLIEFEFLEAFFVPHDVPHQLPVSSNQLDHPETVEVLQLGLGDFGEKDVDFLDVFIHQIHCLSVQFLSAAEEGVLN